MRGPNYYTIIGVHRHTAPSEFRQAYKERVLYLHPDKNPTPDAQDRFDECVRAYEVRLRFRLDI